MARHPLRRQLNITTTQELFDQVKTVCTRLDMPVTVWVRELIKRELNNPTITQ